MQAQRLQADIEAGRVAAQHATTDAEKAAAAVKQLEADIEADLKAKVSAFKLQIELLPGRKEISLYPLTR